MSTVGATELERAERAAELVRGRHPTAPTVGVVLGSGLGPFADELAEATSIRYEEIPGFAQSTVPGHSGRLVIGKVGGVEVAALQGRVHVYEGHVAADVVLPVRTLRQLGVRRLIVTNAAGSVNPDYDPGDLMVIDDHLNLTGLNPLTGPNDGRLGPRFPDMTDAYSPALKAAALRVAKGLGLTPRLGVYAGLTGPAYETPAEIRMLRQLGADAVGMSTVLEVIAARHAGLEVLGISCITNHGAGLGTGPLTHDEVSLVAARARDAFRRLVSQIVTLEGP